MQTQASSRGGTVRVPPSIFPAPIETPYVLNYQPLWFDSVEGTLHSCVVCFSFFKSFPVSRIFRAQLAGEPRDWEVSTHTWEGWGGRYFCISCALETVGQKMFNGYYSSATYRMDFHTVKGKFCSLARKGMYATPWSSGQMKGARSKSVCRSSFRFPLPSPPQ